MKIRVFLMFFIVASVTSCQRGRYKSEIHKVQARENVKDTTWESYTAVTIDELPGFRYSKDPEISAYGGWKVFRSTATGFYRVEKRRGRWWIIDPEGYPYLNKAVCVFMPGTSDGQKSALIAKYGSEDNWVKRESDFLKEIGFNGTGSFGAIDLMRKNNIQWAYTLMARPMFEYKREHSKKYGKYEQAGFQGYRYDLVMAFDPEFDAYVEKAIAPCAQYANDRNMLGYYIDNELPWKKNALDRHLTYLGKTEPGYIAAKKWLDQRKGKDTSIEDVNDQDRLEFTGFYFETYIRKVSEALRKYDPNHLFLGCRFNKLSEVWDNPEIFRVAGKYMDIISINHYRHWEPDQSIMANWATWSGKPFLITEFYVKGEDSGLPNNAGAGWIVQTQEDRGLFYQNFTINLLKNKSCVGWHWFTYQDNDPTNFKASRSQRDSNKGIVDGNFVSYKPLVAYMSLLNNHTYELIQYLDKK